MSKFELSPVTKEFLLQKQTHLPDKTVPVIAGVSGGPDSMAMLYLLHRFDVDTVVVHCNYQLRGKASDKDQELVEEICMHWNLECVSLRFDSKQESEGKNFQNWARDRRYKAFEDIRREYNANLIVTAHHQDDQIETILQKILRGSGLASWSGMDVIEGNLFRPLLNISKSEIMDFVEEFNVPYRIDRTNEESTYARNFIRNHWFPDLNRLFPGWKENLLRIAARADEFEVMTEWILAHISEEREQLNREKFLNLPDTIRPVILLEFIKKGGVDVEISQGFLENSDDLIGLESGGKLQISDNYIIMRDRSSFKIVEDTKSVKVHQFIQKDDVEKGIETCGFLFSKESKPKAFLPERLYLDFNQLEFPLTIRNWKAGDRFQPFGMDGSQLISDHLTNRKIPSDQKKHSLVLESFDDTISAVIFPANLNVAQIGTISENVRCSTGTQNVLTIRTTD